MVPAPVLDATLASRLRLSIVRLGRRLRAQCAPDGVGVVSLAQSSAMATLGREGSMTPGTLAASERLAPSTMTRVIANLEDAGWVSRHKDPTDGRRSILTLTVAGADRLGMHTVLSERWLDQRLTELNDTERATLAAAARIMDRLAADTPGTDPTAATT
jgi:DNA-binding MarR family transcriptional regulator